MRFRAVRADAVSRVKTHTKQAKEILNGTESRIEEMLQNSTKNTRNDEYLRDIVQN